MNVERRPLLNLNDLPSGGYLKTEDLMGREVTVTIESVCQERMGDGKYKGVLYFRGKHKGMTLNKVNADALSSAFGPYTSDMIGKRVVIYPTTTEFKGDVVSCMRIRVPDHDPRGPTDRDQPKQGALINNDPNADRGTTASGHGPNDPDDEIPF